MYNCNRIANEFHSSLDVLDYDVDEVHPSTLDTVYSIFNVGEIRSSEARKSDWLIRVWDGGAIENQARDGASERSESSVGEEIEAPPGT